MNPLALIKATEIFVEPHLILAMDGKISAANDAAIRQLEYGKFLVGRHLSEISADPPERLNGYLRLCGGSRPAAIGNLTLRNSESRPVRFRCDGGLLVPSSHGSQGLILMRCRESQPALNGFAVLTKKIEELNAALRAQRTIRNHLEVALAEKEVLLRELHHRVKNNLQNISSLFRIAIIREPDQRIKLKLREALDRVQAIAAVDRLLFEQADRISVNAADLLLQLANGLIESHSGATIGVRFDLENIDVEPRLATPLALIANEVITNCLKHAFSDGKPGEIRIVLKCRSDSLAEFVVSDNGCGIPAGTEQHSGLGLTLMRALSASVGHELKLERASPGTTARMVFPIEAKLTAGSGKS